MSEKATEPKAPEVHVKAAPKRPAKPAAPAKPAKPAKPAAPAKPSLTETAKKHLAELAERIEAADKAKAERLAVMQKEHERGVPTAEIAAAASLSVPRARQLLGK